MAHYKNAQNKIYWLDACDDPKQWLPADCVEITDTEADDIRRAEITPPTYQELRAAAYPSMADYLDGIVKGDTAQVKGYIDACLAVKVKYPKE